MCAARPDFLSDEDMRAEVSQQLKGVQFVLVRERLWHPVPGGWEAYADDAPRTVDIPGHRATT